MADPARLDVLRQQFATNPRRYFAPLANALRRAGDAQAAAALTRAHLAEQPEHLTAHVILGQALADTGDGEGARLAFERAHAVDPGNTVALEALVVLARHAGDGRAAAHWVARLREADPEHAAAEASPVDAFEPFELDAFGTDDREAFDAGTLEPAAEVFEPHAFAADAAPVLPPDVLAARPDGAAPHDAVPHDAMPHLTVPHDVAATGVSSDGILPGGDLLDDLLDPVVGLDAPPTDPVPPPMREVLPELLAADAAAEDAPDRAAAKLAAEPADAPPPPAAPFVTETMAGLLLAQGHAAQALDVYAQLLAQRPDDERLRARVAALRAEVHGGTADLSGGSTEAPTDASDAAPAPAEAPAVDASDERAARMWRVAFAAVPNELPVTPGVPAPQPDGAAAGVAAGDVDQSPDVPNAPAVANVVETFGGEPEPAMPEPAADFERWAAAVDRSEAVHPADASAAPQAAGADPGVEAPTAVGQAPADDLDEDLARFNAWLRGLDG